MSVTERRASCQCGQLSLVCTGEPLRISVCHCLECQKRSGAPFAAQARYPAAQVTVTGESRRWTRIGSSGNPAEHHFCDTCGTTLWYHTAAYLPDAFAVAIGAFADPAFPAPSVSVYENRKHPWLAIVGDGIEHD